MYPYNVRNMSEVQSQMLHLRPLPVLGWLSGHLEAQNCPGEKPR